MNEKIHLDAVYLEGGDILLDPRPRQFITARRGRFCGSCHTVLNEIGPIRVQVTATFHGDQFTSLGRFFLQ